MGPMLSFDDWPDENLPFYHKLWAYPMALLCRLAFLWITVWGLIAVIPPFNIIVGLTQTDRKLSKSVKAIIYPFKVVLSAIVIIGFLPFIALTSINERYK